jgi:HAD superfamily hydrolase (TIGR01549 family)
MDIKAVILDFGGTLSDGALNWEPYHENIRSYLAGQGYSVPMKELKKALRGALAELNRVRDKGREMVFEEVYGIFLSKLRVMYDDDMLEYLHDNFRKHYETEFYPCVEEVLKELSSKYKVALLSNTMSDQPIRLINAAGLDKYFDVMHCSSMLGVRKPNPEIFDIVLNDLGVHPVDAVHVGDSVEADMFGARESGITGVWIKTPDQPLWNGYAVNSVCNLPRFLETLD